jgi:DNA-directed RNA polymerase subunit M/transcription elongation factor TFIIS
MHPRHQSGLAVVAAFLYAHEAHLAKALLESEGIEAWVLDEDQVRMQWHLAHALGGIKVAVAPEHLEQARAILREDHSESLRTIEEQTLPASTEESCPRCGQPAAHVSTERRLPRAWQWLSTIVFFLFGALAAHRRRTLHYSCGHCAHQWSATH